MQRSLQGIRHAQRRIRCSGWCGSRGMSFLHPDSYYFADTPYEPPRLPLNDIVENIDEVAKNADARKVPIPELDQLPSLYREEKKLREKVESLTWKRNRLTERVHSLLRDRSEEGKAAKQRAIEEARNIRDQVQAANRMHEEQDEHVRRIAMAIPNWSHPDVPVGGYDHFREIARGGPDPGENDSTRSHTDIASDLNLVDLSSAAITTGNSWYYLTNEAVALEQALVNYAFSVAAADGWKMVTTPDVVKSDLAWRCGFQPREDDAGQTFFVESSSMRAKKRRRTVDELTRKLSSSEVEPELVLAGTAEIPLAGLFAFHTFKKEGLPINVVGLGRAFRAEAGARGRDTKGIYRVHQFTKVELFAITHADASESMMERMLSLQRRIIDGLNIPYRVLDMPTEELGASAWRKYDIEAWMPGRGEWGEICSLSNCTDYQSRRLNIDYVENPNPTEDAEPGAPANGASERKKKWKEFAHTLNGTAVAVPRLIIALLENGAIVDEGKAVALRLPQALRRFWFGAEDRIRWI